MVIRLSAVASGLRPPWPWPEVLFLPFEKNVDNVSFSFGYLVLFVKGEDKWKVVNDWADGSFVSCLVS